MRPNIEETTRKPHYGRCRICSKYSRFTKEHVPPKSSGNRGGVIVLSPATDASGRRTSMLPCHESTDGIFLYSLCDRCNNKTGSRYGSDYSAFVDTVRVHANTQNVNQFVPIAVGHLHPLRIIKQATSMMLSTSQPTDFRGHEFVAAPGRTKKDLQGIEIVRPDVDRQREIFNELKAFVRRRDSNDFPKDVGVYLFASVSKRIGFRTGVFSRINLSSRTSVVAAATGLYPVHWIFTLGGELNENILDVTSWTGFGYKERFNKSLPVPMRWLEGHYPLDFRSPQDLLTSNFINSMKFEGFRPTSVIDRDRLLSEALFFARALGKLTQEGYTISEFSTGTFYEYGDINGWIENASTKVAIDVLTDRLRREALSRVSLE